MSHVQLSVGSECWVSNNEGCWDSAKVVDIKDNRGGKCVATVKKHNGTLDTTNYQSLQPRNPSVNEAPIDLTTLTYLNEPSVLQALRYRYENHLLYTFSGIVLISVNPYQLHPELYNESVIKRYHENRECTKEPHLYSIASSCYSALTNDDENQTIIVSGESGAGKTVAARYIMRYLTSVQALDKATSKRSVENQVLATNPIMEAFGNAKTIRNDNSSRFGKYVTISFNEEAAITGANVSTYLLERSRVTCPPVGERNYHIFYQLLAGCTLEQREKWYLGSPSEFNYLSQGNCIDVEGVNDNNEFTTTASALSTVGILENQQEEVYKLLAALLHLGNVTIVASRNEATIKSDDKYLCYASQLLGINPSALAKLLSKKLLKTRSETIVTSASYEHVLSTRDSVAKYLYSTLFSWVVHMINASLDHSKVKRSASKHIGVVDIYGFEHFERNSLEQFCINYANEKLQQEFNKHVFKLEQEEYIREGLDWRLIDYADNQGCISLIEDNLGVLSLLDEECRLPSGTDGSFLQKLNNQTPQKHAPFFKKSRFNDGSFTIKHYASDVTYQVQDFLAKNSDSLPVEIISLLRSSENQFVAYLLDYGTQSIDAHNTATKKRINNKKPSLTSMFRTSLSHLMNTISATNVHYIRCIKPNEEKTSWSFSAPLVLSQLRACGVFETIRISSLGFPKRFSYDEFTKRFRVLLSFRDWNQDSKKLSLQIISTVLSTTNSADYFQFGKLKVFFRSGVIGLYETRRRELCNKSITLLQSLFRGFSARKKYKKVLESIVGLQSLSRGKLARERFQKRKREMAATIIQNLWRTYLQRKKYNTFKKLITGCQTIGRGYLLRTKYKTLLRKHAASVIIMNWRSYHAGVAFRKYKRTVIGFQCVVRSVLTRRYLRQLKDTAGRSSILLEKRKSLRKSVKEGSSMLETATKEVVGLRNKLSEMTKSLVRWKGLFTDPELKNDVNSDYYKHVNEHSQISELLHGEVKLRQAALQLSAAASKSETVFIKSQLARDNLNTYYNTLKKTASLKSKYDTKGLHSRNIFYTRDQYLKYHSTLMFLPTYDWTSVEERYNLKGLETLLKSKLLHCKKDIQSILVSDAFPTALNRYNKKYMQTRSVGDSLVFGGVINFLIYSGCIYSLKEELDIFIMKLNGCISFLAELSDPCLDESNVSTEFKVEYSAFWLSNLHEVRSFVTYLQSSCEKDLFTRKDETYWNASFSKLLKVTLEAEGSLFLFLRNSANHFIEGSSEAILCSRLLSDLIDINTEARKQPKSNMHLLIEKLDYVYDLINKSSLQEAPLKEITTLILQYVGENAFSKLINGRTCYTWKDGSQISYNTSLLINWCHQKGLSYSNTSLLPLMQSSLLFSLRKKDEQDFKIILSVCNLLSPYEIIRLLDHYRPCIGEEQLPKAFLKAVEQTAHVVKPGEMRRKVNSVGFIPVSSNFLVLLEENPIYDELHLAAMTKEIQQNLF
ncbi:myosin-51 [Schizosaccharomyces cryophilus OY26]|uniref:Myosin-51 n=1 Tax=Schizosaccharomyces cryophilus (strain OY26 / ATCC MYA-4695 / CBS 11777 / NBRC 106824 / NRRL Y48691) TaxID=653667 RepID=S9W865_SCHCR|nr:myosin-51 [Schizosaccharomyces cryophilus OY26]EPY53940.1 myosin-51 [Schizosaccharomyces cryophilus OY26]